MAAYIWTHLEAICMPLVMKTALRTDIVCPSKVLRQLQSLTAQSFRVVSAEAVRTHWVEGGSEGGREKGERMRKRKERMKSEDKESEKDEQNRRSRIHRPGPQVRTGHSRCLSCDLSEHPPDFHHSRSTTAGRNLMLKAAL